jgi:hypothetical protein
VGSRNSTSSARLSVKLATPHVMRRSGIIERPKRRIDRCAGPFLCQRKPATTQSQSRHV